MSVVTSNRMSFIIPVFCSGRHDCGAGAGVVQLFLRMRVARGRFTLKLSPLPLLLLLMLLRPPLLLVESDSEDRVMGEPRMGGANEALKQVRPPPSFLGRFPRLF